MENKIETTLAFLTLLFLSGCMCDDTGQWPMVPTCPADMPHQICPPNCENAP